VGAITEVGGSARRRVRDDDSLILKRNPDLAELARAEAGPALGRLVAALSVLKGLPIGYQRDLQRTKRDLFEGVDRSLALLAVMAPMVRSARYRSTTSPRQAWTAPVEMVDGLVRSWGLFRDAHASAGGSPVEGRCRSRRASPSSGGSCGRRRLKSPRCGPPPAAARGARSGRSLARS
jgi:hypothetical protein